MLRNKTIKLENIRKKIQKLINVGPGKTSKNNKSRAYVYSGVLDYILKSQVKSSRSSVINKCPSWELFAYILGPQ